MEKRLAFVIVFIVLAYGLYKAKSKNIDPITAHKETNYQKHIATHTTPHYTEELKKLHTTTYVKHYIIDVINHGSTQLHFKPTESMDGGFASREDAPKIACYVLELSGKKCKTPYSKDAAMYYSSNCAGCHGDDGKGLHGAYPDLTASTLLGIKKREAFLSSVLK